MTTPDTVEGVLPVDKPVGPTSHDVVAAARRALGTRRIGHTGTLDPFASGLLLLCVGQATRIAEFLTGLPKRYEAELRLGVATDTDDLTGAVLAESAAWRHVSRDQADAVVHGFVGDILQVPSAFSAKKQQGVRAYAAARAGAALQLEPVAVRIAELRITGWEPPHVRLEVACSTGTYVRALARDIGAALGVGGHLTMLRRTAVGSHAVTDALPVEELGDAARVRAVLVTPLDALGSMPRVELDDAALEHVRHGRAVRAECPAGEVALAAGGRLIGIGRADGEIVRPRKVFPA
jgi:tRNA pseudouridine55 synthase